MEPGRNAGEWERAEGIAWGGCILEWNGGEERVSDGVSVWESYKQWTTSERVSKKHIDDVTNVLRSDYLGSSRISSFKSLKMDLQSEGRSSTWKRRRRGARGDKITSFVSMVHVAPREESHVWSQATREDESSKVSSDGGSSKDCGDGGSSKVSGRRRRGEEWIRDGREYIRLGGLSLARFAHSCIESSWNVISKEFHPPSPPPPRQLMNSAARASSQYYGVLMKRLPLLERASIGAIAGGFAGGLSHATLHPIDTVKTKMQCRGSQAVYSGPIDVIQKVIQNQGIKGLYRGLPAAVIGSIPSSAIYFGAYELAKGLLIKIMPKMDGSLVPPVAAALGNLTSSAIFVPKEVIKQRMQAGDVSGGARKIILSILKTEGWKGFYVGYSATLLRNLPSNMIRFTTFEYMKSALLIYNQQTRGVSDLEEWQTAFAGAMAGAVAVCGTMPLDVAKTRMITQARSAVSLAGAGTAAAAAAAGGSSQATAMASKAMAALSSSYSAVGLFGTMQQIWMEEGMRGLWAGVEPRLLHSACFGAIGFWAFETAKKTLLKHHMKRKEARGIQPRGTQGREREEEVLSTEENTVGADVQSLETGRRRQEASKG